MKYLYLMRAAAAVAALGAGGVFAQTTPTTPSTPTEGAPAVVSDVGPPPPEDRSSTGAIVLENSLVRAQRENAFQRSSSQTGVASVGRRALRMTMKEKTQADLAQAREAEAIDLRTRGAGSLTGR